jgi:hypothetical protein
MGLFDHSAPDADSIFKNSRAIVPLKDGGEIWRPKLAPIMTRAPRSATF